MELVRPRKPFGLRQIDLVLVPGLAFDRNGYRMGYGGGVYDRLLSRTPQARHIGLFFSQQFVHALPKESFDQKMDIVLTEKGIPF
jgi:5-formyltetrahydrofolate cyclo-ligase